LIHGLIAWLVDWFSPTSRQDREGRQQDSECEGVWRSSESLGEDAQVFWGLTGEYSGNYYGPSNFDWDIGNNNAIPLMDDPNLHGITFSLIPNHARVFFFYRSPPILIRLQYCTS
jgi:hypothetical protein